MSGYSFSIERLRAWSNYVLAALIVGALCEVATHTFVYFEQKGLSIGLDPHRLVLAMALIWVITVLIMWLCFLRWVYLAHANLRALGFDGGNFTPGWAVGWYFIPIANLWKPLEAMRELWQASYEGFMRDRTETPHILWIWWVTFLIAPWVLPFLLNEEAYGPMEVVVTISNITGLYLTWRVVDIITRRQAINPLTAVFE